MPKLSLDPHPDSHSPIEAIEVDVARDASGLLRLNYRVSGALDEIAIPAARIPSRTDELWKHSCFEAFLGANTGYYELNFSPSSRWAAYRFDGYRAGMREASLADPIIAWNEGNGEGMLAATIQLPAHATGPLGLCAVIEDREGGKSYWALAHPPGTPDFHHAACFAASLPPAG